MVHELVVDHTKRLDFDVVFDVVSLGIVNPRSWMKRIELIEGIDANGSCRKPDFVLNGSRWEGSSVHDSVFGSIPLGSASPVVRCDCPE